MWKESMVDLSQIGDSAIPPLAKGIVNQVEMGRVLSCREIGRDPTKLVPTVLSTKELFEQKVVVPNVGAQNKLVERRLTVKEIMLALDVSDSLRSNMSMLSRNSIVNWLRVCVPSKI